MYFTINLNIKVAFDHHSEQQFEQLLIGLKNSGLQQGSNA